MISNQSIGTWIERRARSAPDNIAVIFGDTHRTYADLAGRVRRLAQQLRALGVTRADRVAWLGPNHPAFLEILFATAKLGAVLAPINHRLERGAIETICSDAAPRLVFIDASLSDITLPPSVATTVTVGPRDARGQYEQLIGEGRDEPIDEPVTFDDLFLLPFTSGTTGAPKGIMLTHGNLTWNVINLLSAVDIRPHDVTIAVAPFFRTGGTGINVLPVLFKGGTVVIPNGTEPDEIFDLMERHRVTIGFGSPDLLRSLTRSPRWHSADFSSLRMFMTGGAPVHERLLRASHERGFNVLQGYGLSEAGPFVSVLDGGNAWRKLGSAGRPALFVDVRIDRGDGSEAASGEIGELFVRGPNVMIGYWRRPDATRRALNDDGWLRTGDVAFVDSDGFLFIVGRAEDAYMSAGVLVHPGIVERVLRQHPAVAEASVLGGDDGAVAYIVLEPWADREVESSYVEAGFSRPVWAELEAQLRSLCHEQLPVYARPAAIERVAALPKNPAGKILRHRIRDDLAAVLLR
ncbi:MAG TPA: AMP-binding protein [Vicinamibacterales bacterium]|nr:AMP-binding protein [Vicinamibacterales bacterium]